MGEVIAIQDAKPMTAGDIQKQVNTIQHVMKQVMKKDTHYGVIPGTKAPSLYKPGAEKIMATFRLSADPEVTDMSNDDQIRYVVKVRLVSPSGVFVGAGIGECSSNEEKYKWRNAVCDEEFEETEPGRRREKWNKGFNNAPAYKRRQIRTEPADLANTILKMAKKRALIDAVLTATAASDIFTQDVEDLPPEYQDGDAPQQPQRPSSPPPRQTQRGAQDPNNPATEKQIGLLRSKLKSANKSEADLCKEFEIDALENLPFRHVNGAIDWITQ